MTSPALQQAAARTRTEAEARAEIAARRAKLAADMRNEGASDVMVDRLATDETAGKMLTYERQCCDAIMAMFGPKP